MRLAAWEPMRFTLECLASVAVIMGVPLFLLQEHNQTRIRSADDKKRIAQDKANVTLRFIEIANNDEYLQVRSRLSQPWEPVDVSELVRQGMSDAELEEAKLRVTSTISDDDVEKLSDLYRLILTCERDEYCDSRLIDAFYRSDIRDFYCAYRPRLKLISVRLNKPSYLSDFSGVDRTCSVPATP